MKVMIIISIYNQKIMNVPEKLYKVRVYENYQSKNDILL